MSETDLPFQALFIWIAAALSLLLLILTGWVSRIMASRDASPASWLGKGLVASLLVFLAFFPALMVKTPGAAVNAGLMFYILFFSGFCYYLGRRSGWAAGRRHLGEILGMESPDHMEDTQDRLFESRLRFPSRADVVKSIGALANRDRPDGEPGDTRPDRVDLGPGSSVTVDPELAQIEAFFNTAKDKQNRRQ